MINNISKTGDVIYFGMSESSTFIMSKPGDPSTTRVLYIDNDNVSKPGEVMNG